ncbi:MAG: tRNA1(Val) (adenine(37)-N6)-methyltransferase [Paludibacteraceae bacterium]
MTRFSFKQFDIDQDHCAMKVGTDGVLLGAWCTIDGARHILDIGTGTGLIALMVAQRNPQARIDAIDIDADAVQQAHENCAASPFGGRIRMWQADARTFAAPDGTTYDTIVCNPPYFVDALKCPDTQRTIARHNDTLPFDTLLTTVRRLLADNGRFSVILPCREALSFSELAATQQLHLTRLTHLLPTPSSAEKRRLMEFEKHPRTLREESLVIELARHCYSPAYRDLTKNFYLKF